MDLLQEIETKSQILSEDSSHTGIQAVVRHIKSAERYLLRSRDERDDDLLNDVVYRTNQAFEGMLKEAYSVLAGSDGRRLSPHQIEQHLINNSVLTDRVTELLKNYRQNWRNPSTHDHTLFFKEQESLLAIVSVSAFATILLDQIIEKVSYNREVEKLSDKKSEISSKLSKQPTDPLDEQILMLLELFNEDLSYSDIDLSQAREIEILGQLSAFVGLLDPSITTHQEQRINTNSPTETSLIADFVFTKGDESVLLEIKRPGYSISNVGYVLEQMRVYLSSGQFNRGVIYLPPRSKDEPMKITQHEIKYPNRIALVNVYAPQQ